MGTGPYPWQPPSKMETALTTRSRSGAENPVQNEDSSLCPRRGHSIFFSKLINEAGSHGIQGLTCRLLFISIHLSNSRQPARTTLQVDYLARKSILIYTFRATLLLASPAWDHQCEIWICSESLPEPHM